MLQVQARQEMQRRQAEEQKRQDIIKSVRAKAKESVDEKERMRAINK